MYIYIVKGFPPILLINASVTSLVFFFVFFFLVRTVKFYFQLYNTDFSYIIHCSPCFVSDPMTLFGLVNWAHRPRVLGSQESAPFCKDQMINILLFMSHIGFHCMIFFFFLTSFRNVKIIHSSWTNQKQPMSSCKPLQVPFLMVSRSHNIFVKEDYYNWQ